MNTGFAPITAAGGVSYRARPGMLAASAAAGAFALFMFTATSYGQPQAPDDGRVGQGQAAGYAAGFPTLTVRKDAGVLFAQIAAPPMNLLGPELVRDPA